MIKPVLHYILLLFVVYSCKSPVLISNSSLQNEHNVINLNKKAPSDLDAIFLATPHPEKVKTILLDSLNLKSIPASISRFYNLKHLSLANNPKLDLEKVIKRIKTAPIQFLNLQKNELHSVPKNLTELQNLTELNLAHNRLQKADNFTFLSKIKNLKELWLDHNQLDSLPKTIGKLKQLKRLYIGHNKLNKLPNELENLKKLSVLHAEYNAFEAFPEIFLKTKSLILVHLNNNKISSIPRSFQTQKFSIKGLVLNNNPINDNEKKWIKNEFSHFFLLSLD